MNNANTIKLKWDLKIENKDYRKRFQSQLLDLQKPIMKWIIILFAIMLAANVIHWILYF